MSRPTEPVLTPSVVTDIAAGRPVTAVWVNELGGVTFAIAGGSEYVKIYPEERALLLAAEAPRLTWARRYAAGLAGRSAVDPRWVSDPRTAARAIGAGLCQLRDTLPVDDWPVGHGDACAPNTLIDDGGHCCGHVDLGDLGVAPRADLAVAEWSLGYNYGGDWRDEFFDAYVVAPDQHRMDHYLRLWEDDD